MKKKLLKKSVCKFSKVLAQAHGFDLYKPTLLLKKSNSILQIISFNLPPSGLYCNIAVIPTYVPTEVIYYNIGNRLNHIKTIISGNWCAGDTEEEILSDLEIIRELIESNVLPWFNEVSEPNSFVKMLERELLDETKRVTMCPPHLIYLYIGFSYLFNKEYESAETALKIAMQNTIKYAYNLKEKSPLSLVQPNLELLEKKQFDEADKNIDRYIQQTLQNLGLE